MTAQLYKIDAISAMLDNDENEIKGLAEMFVELVPGMMNDLDTAIQKEDWHEAGLQAHKLKSTIKIWQIESLYDDILFVEQHGKAMDEHVAIVEKNTNIQKVLAQVVSELKADFSL
jgi:HPt (histidine-containing phosphotransfer) domain-containing protein